YDLLMHVPSGVPDSAPDLHGTVLTWENLLDYWPKPDSSFWFFPLLAHKINTFLHHVSARGGSGGGSAAFHPARRLVNVPVIFAGAAIRLHICVSFHCLLPRFLSHPPLGRRPSAPG